MLPFTEEKSHFTPLLPPPPVLYCTVVYSGCRCLNKSLMQGRDVPTSMLMETGTSFWKRNDSTRRGKFPSSGLSAEKNSCCSICLSLSGPAFSPPGAVLGSQYVSSPGAVLVVARDHQRLPAGAGACCSLTTHSTAVTAYTARQGPEL